MSAEPTPAQTETYWEDLHDLTDDQFVIACTRARREWDRPYVLPPIAMLIRFAAEAAQASGAIVNGDQAWDAFRSRVLARYSFGVTKTFDWPDELTREVVRNHIGIDSAAVHTLAMLENDIERDKYRKRFVAEYNARRNTATAQQAAGLAVPELPRLPEHIRAEHQSQQVEAGGGWLAESIRPLPTPQRPRLVAGDE